MDVKNHRFGDYHVPRLLKMTTSIWLSGPAVTQHLGISAEAALAMVFFGTTGQPITP